MAKWELAKWEQATWSVAKWERAKWGRAKWERAKWGWAKLERSVWQVINEGPPDDMKWVDIKVWTLSRHTLARHNTHSRCPKWDSRCPKWDPRRLSMPQVGSQAPLRSIRFLHDWVGR